MFGVNDLPTFVIGTIAIVLLPGPNSLFVLSTAAKHGVRRGYQAAAGVFVGDTVLMVAAAAGAASLLRAYPPVFLVLKWAGAAYLCYVGVNMAIGAVRAARRRKAQAVPTEEKPAVDAPLRPFQRAAVISLLNPKAILFFISFWVQFLDPDYAYPALSFMLLAGIVQVASACYLTVLIFSGTYLSSQFQRRRRLTAGLTAGVGALFVGFGIRLATASLG